MKRIALTFLFCLWSATAWATCASPISGKDGGGSTITLGAVVDGSSNCWGGVAIGDGVAFGKLASVTAAGVSGTNGIAVQGMTSGVAMPASITTWGGGTLGAMANYGVSPGAVLVPGVNAFITNSNANGQATSANSSPVVIASNQSAVPVSSTTYPATAVPITASATGTTAATTATLTNVSGHTTYICGFSIRANAAAAATGNATVTGTITATMNFTQWTAPNASGLGVTEEVFSPCVPASAVSTSINVISAAPGTSGVVSVSAWGYSI